MKKLVTILLISSLSLSAFSQVTKIVEWYDWSDPVTFQLSPMPVITGYGPLSDSLSNVYDGKTFYVYNGDYYMIDSWADYYYWYIQKYWYHFDDPGLYEFFYLTENDYGMAAYIAGDYYRAYYYPSRVMVRFSDRTVYYNRLEDSRYMAETSKEISRLSRRLERTPVLAKNPNLNSSFHEDNGRTTRTYNQFRRAETSHAQSSVSKGISSPRHHSSSSSSTSVSGQSTSGSKSYSGSSNAGRSSTVRTTSTPARSAPGKAKVSNNTISK